MASCASCRRIIVFGGRKDGGLRYCNSRCQRRHVPLRLADDVPDDLLHDYVMQVHEGACPHCSRDGPVDLYVSHRIWSVLLISSWSSRPAVCCRTCGTRRVLGDALSSAILGWWSFPWGVIMTPVQIGRNIVTLVRPPVAGHPSAALQAMLRLDLAQALAHPVAEDREEA